MPEYNPAGTGRRNRSSCLVGAPSLVPSPLSLREAGRADSPQRRSAEQYRAPRSIRLSSSNYLADLLACLLHRSKTPRVTDLPGSVLARFLELRGRHIVQACGALWYTVPGTLSDESAVPDHAQSRSRGAAPHDPRRRGLRRPVPLLELERPGKRPLCAAPAQLRHRISARQTQTASAPRPAMLRSAGRRKRPNSWTKAARSI